MSSQNKQMQDLLDSLPAPKLQYNIERMMPHPEKQRPELIFGGIKPMTEEQRKEWYAFCNSKGI